MPFPIKTVNDEKPRELCPAENMRGLVTKILYLGTLPNAYEPDKPAVETLYFCFELDAETPDGRRHVLSKQMTYSLHEKATLTKWFAPVLGDKWPVSGQQFHIGDLLGLSCMVSVVHYLKRDGQPGAKISSISKLARGMEPLESDSDQILMSYDDPQWPDSKAIPDWIKDLAASNVENQQSKQFHGNLKSTAPRPAATTAALNLGTYSQPPVDPENGEEPSF